MKYFILLCINLIFCQTILPAHPVSSSPGVKTQFPRFGAIVLNTIRYKDSAFIREVAKTDIMVLGFNKTWQPENIRSVVKAIKAINPHTLIGNYSNVMEVTSAGIPQQESREVVEANNWWARTTWPDGEKITAYRGTCQINITNGAKTDSNGEHWTQWYAKWINRSIYSDISEFDFWYTDNLNRKPPNANSDWDQDGVTDNNKDSLVQKNYRLGMMAYVNAVRKLRPEYPIMPNVSEDLSDPEYKGQFEYALIESAMGQNWSQVQNPVDVPVNPRNNWTVMMARYRQLMKNTKAPHLVMFNVHGRISNPMTEAQQQWFRYCYTSCLLDDGYFCFTDETVKYNSFPWFKEYEFKLGEATSLPPDQPWQNGVWRRTFSNGTILVNPTADAQTVTLPDGKTLTIASKDGYIWK